MVFTGRFAARRLGVDIDAIEQLAEQMAPEDGCLSVIASLDETAESVTGLPAKASTTSTNFWTNVGHSSWENRPRHGLRRMDTINPARRGSSLAASELARSRTDGAAHDG
ncbi:MAG: hypothetical protein JWR80_5061 [Bradyrhizobium sp.]|nr:hypothetical protein [Bradyrhizobium sp.]